MALTAKQRKSAESRREKLVCLCTALPETKVEPVGDGHLAIRVRKKTFAYYLFDHHGDGQIAFCCKSTLDEQRRLIAEDSTRYFVPAYLGPKGWLGFRLDTATLDWGDALALLKTAYRLIAARKLAAEV